MLVAKLVRPISDPFCVYFLLSLFSPTPPVIIVFKGQTFYPPSPFLSTRNTTSFKTSKRTHRTLYQLKVLWNFFLLWCINSCTFICVSVSRLAYGLSNKWCVSSRCVSVTINAPVAQNQYQKNDIVHVTSTQSGTSRCYPVEDLSYLRPWSWFHLLPIRTGVIRLIRSHWSKFLQALVLKDNQFSARMLGPSHWFLSNDDISILGSGIDIEVSTGVENSGATHSPVKVNTHITWVRNLSKAGATAQVTENFHIRSVCTNLRQDELHEQSSTQHNLYRSDRKRLRTSYHTKIS